MKKILPPIILICILIAGCKKEDVKIAPPSEEIATSSSNPNESEQAWDVPVDAVFFNECCNEEVYVTGTAHFTDNRNIQHVVVNNITGTGLSSGLTYVSLSPSILTNVFYSNQVEGIFTFMLNMRNDNGCSFRSKATFQIHANANGTITVAFQNYETFCH